MKHVWLIILGPILLSSCYKEVANIEPEVDRFDLEVSPETRDFIFSSRDTAYTVADTVLQLSFNDQAVDLEEIRVRGNSALDYRRKSYAVFLHESISVVDRYHASVKELKRFKLLALTMDYTYIENRLAFGILQEAGIMPLFFKFVELRMNGNTQGVYLLLEDPEQYYKEINSEFILRRGYNHHIDDMDYTPSVHFIPKETYVNEFHSIYNLLNKFQGESLLEELGARLDLTGYFRKMGIDYLLQNGDYTDELYLYAIVEGGRSTFHPIPWDYDDIFASKPHEIGRSWGMGTIFGNRYYATMEEVYDEIGHKMIYSIEDDLDYTIARDPVMYEAYTQDLAALMAEITPGIIDRVFRETEEELTPFYQSISIIGQSEYDRHATTSKLWKENMKEKREWLIKRRAEIQEMLEGG